MLLRAPYIWFLGRCLKGASRPAPPWQPHYFLLTPLPLSPPPPWQVFVRHLLEDHATAPFLALQHRPWAFARPGTAAAAKLLDEGAFFGALRRDPAAFLQAAVVEVR